MNIQHSRILQPGLPPMFFSGNKKDMGSKWVVQAPKLETKKTCNGRMRSAIGISQVANRQKNREKEKGFLGPA